MWPDVHHAIEVEQQNIVLEFNIGVAHEVTGPFSGRAPSPRALMVALT